MGAQPGAVQLTRRDTTPARIFPVPATKFKFHCLHNSLSPACHIHWSCHFIEGFPEQRKACSSCNKVCSQSITAMAFLPFVISEYDRGHQNKNPSTDFKTHAEHINGKSLGTIFLCTWQWYRTCHLCDPKVPHTQQNRKRERLPSRSEITDVNIRKTVCDSELPSECQELWRAGTRKHNEWTENAQKTMKCVYEKLPWWKAACFPPMPDLFLSFGNIKCKWTSSWPLALRPTDCFRWNYSGVISCIFHKTKTMLAWKSFPWRQKGDQSNYMAWKWEWLNRMGVHGICGHSAGQRDLLTKQQNLVGRQWSTKYCPWLRSQWVRWWDDEWHKDDSHRDSFQSLCHLKERSPSFVKSRECCQHFSEILQNCNQIRCQNTLY